MTNDALLLKQSIEKHVRLSNTDFETVLQHAVLKKYRKGQFLIPEGGTKRKTHFVTHGAVIAYFMDENANEHVIQFGVEGWWISDIHSYITGQAAMLNVKAIEDSQVYEFSYSDMQSLYRKVPAVQSYFLIITQNAFASFQERVLFNLSLSAEERYQKFIARYKKIELRFAQKHLASYLGISAEFYSKIKKKLSKS